MNSIDLSKFLRTNIERIVALWVIRIRQEVVAARAEDRIVLRDEIPAFLSYIADALDEFTSQGSRENIRPLRFTSVAKEHGSQRAETGSYSLSEAIFEYHILRLVIFTVLEEHRPLELIEREIIVSAVEMAVQEMASQFAKSELEAQNLFVLTLVHDLRGPLNNASMAAQLLNRQPNPDLSAKTLERLQQNLGRLDKMTTNLLDMRKIFAGEEPALKFEDMDIISLVVACIEEQELGQRIKLVGPSIVNGHWSREGLRRVIDNLASNALKYGTPGTPIVITIKDMPDSVTLSFHNQGPAIPASEQSEIFRTFFQSKSKPGVGWGIGLSLVKAIIDLHNGDINVSSVEGKGTEFVINLPRDSKDK